MILCLDKEFTFTLVPVHSFHVLVQILYSSVVPVSGEMSVEELAAKYAGAYASDFELPDTPSSSEVESDDGESENQETSSDEESEGVLNYHTGAA